MNTNRIGLIGVGTMGKLMMEKLLEHDYQVVAYDIVPQARQYIEEHGGIAASSPQDVAAQADMILLSLPKPAHVQETVEKLVEFLNSNHILVDTSTVDPDTTKKNAALVKEQAGAGYVDAPVLGRPVMVGSWLMPVGGEDTYIDQVEPVLKHFVTRLARCGGPGSGNAIKVLNNTMFSTINAISAEIMEIADKAGVDICKFYETVANSSAGTVSGLFKEVGKRICDGWYEEPAFTIELMCKDANLGLAMAKAAGMNPMITSTVLTLNENARDTGFANLDTSAMYLYFKKMYEG